MRELSLKNCRLDKRYDVLGSLGRGSYAEIYVARDTLSSPQSPHNTVVIKALNVFLQNDLDADLERTLVENFQNEAIALDLVRHPNIISRLGHGTARDLNGTIFHYLVLEYLPGGDLQKICREGELTPVRALSYVEQVCAGLRNAHKNGIIHRDIKPQNLLLTADLESVKIADFGVARFESSATPITRVGTNIFAPPEHSPMMAGQTGALGIRELTPAADIYSLAKTIYMLFTSESPRYFANQRIETLPLASRGESWASALLNVLGRATESDPAARHQSVDEFWQDLSAFREIVDEGEPLTVVRQKTTSVPQPHVSRGYSPMAPMRPEFDTSRNLLRRHPLIEERLANGRPAAVLAADVPEQPSIIDALPNETKGMPIPDYRPPETYVPFKQRRRLVRKAAFLLAILLIFGGGLYGVGMLLRGVGVLSRTTDVSARTAVANTDIYLRPEPNTNNDPIGLVTRYSKVRIVKSQNNWYQVDVIQQGRDRASTLNASRGWLNGKYIDIDD